MKTLLIFSLLTLPLFFSHHIPNSYEKSGEIKSVLKYYKRNYKIAKHTDTSEVAYQKLVSAKFLTKNIRGHTSMVGNYTNYYKKINNVLVSDIPSAEKDSILNDILLTYKDSIKIVSTASIITEKYLFTNIEDSFSQWKDGEWSKHLDFERFCEYLLPFSISEEQPLNNWREDLSTFAYGSIGNLKECYDYQNDPHEAASAVNTMLKNMVSKQYRRIEHHEIPIFDPEVLIKYPCAADCTEMAEMATLIMRSKGIPTTIDYTPQWPDRSGGHTWCVIWSVHGRAESFNPFYSNPGIPFIAHQRVAKVFRKTYSADKQYIELTPAGEPQRLLPSPPM